MNNSTFGTLNLPQAAKEFYIRSYSPYKQLLWCAIQKYTRKPQKRRSKKESPPQKNASKIVKIWQKLSNVVTMLKTNFSGYGRVAGSLWNRHSFKTKDPNLIDKLFGDPERMFCLRFYSGSRFASVRISGYGLHSEYILRLCLNIKICFDYRGKYEWNFSRMLIILTILMRVYFFKICRMQEVRTCV